MGHVLDLCGMVGIQASVRLTVACPQQTGPDPQVIETRGTITPRLARAVHRPFPAMVSLPWGVVDVHALDGSLIRAPPPILIPVSIPLSPPQWDSLPLTSALNHLNC